MSVYKKKLFPLLALGELIVIIFLARANCGHKTITKIKEVPVFSDKTPVACRPMDNNEDKDKVKIDDEDAQNSQRSCTAAKDCGCGYECVNSQCKKFDFSCCTDADCSVGLICITNECGLEGVCTQSECDADADCGRCGARCNNHLCVNSYCCADTDCQTGEYCDLDYGDTIEVKEGNCQKSECAGNADCICSRFCHEHQCHTFNYENNSGFDHCCGGDVYVYSSQACFPRERVENGHCLEDAHCPSGKVCVDWNCLPATCANNTDCGCEAVCRKGHCESGCDDDSGCCDKDYPVCDRGECVNPNEEEDEENDDN